MKHLQYRKIAGTFQTLPSTFCWIVLLFAFTVLPIRADSQPLTIHALLVIIDADPNLGDAMKVNRKNVENLLTTVGSKGDMNVKTQHLLSSKNTATKIRIMEWLEKVDPGDQDVVFVYFSGVGRASLLTETQDEPSLYLQDGELRESDFAKAVQQVATGRLKLLIIDRCNAYLTAPPILRTDHSAMFDQYLKIKHLFREHEGFGHLTSTSANQYSWADVSRGGIFTDTLIQAINQSSGSDVDQNGDTFIEWQEMFDVVQQITGNRFQRAYPRLSKSMQEDLRIRGSDAQTPTAYSLPQHLMSPASDAPKSPLWEFTNADSGFTVSLASDRSTYQLDNALTLHTSTTRDAHFIILNWDNTGELTLLLPNGYQQDNFVEADTPVRFPDADSDFDLYFEGPSGVEYLKLIALRRASDNEAIVNLFLESDKDFESVTDPQRLKVEKKILTYLRRIEPTDWATVSHTVEVLAENIPEPRVDYDKGDIIYVEDKNYKYFAEVTEADDKDHEMITVWIFNKRLRKKLGYTIPTALVVGKRTAPENGWGTEKIILSFYQNSVWTFTKDVMAFEDHFMLPEKIGEEPVQGSRKVKLGDARIPIFDPMSKEE